MLLNPFVIFKITLGDIQFKKFVTGPLTPLIKLELMKLGNILMLLQDPIGLGFYRQLSFLPVMSLKEEAI